MTFGRGAFIGGGGGGGGGGGLSAYRTMLISQFANVPTGTTTAQTGWPTSDANYPFVPFTRACRLVGISFRVSANPADTVTVRAKKNGTADATLECTLAAGAVRKANVTGAGVSFVAGDEISFEATTGASWNNTHDLLVMLELEFTS